MDNKPITMGLSRFNIAGGLTSYKPYFKVGLIYEPDGTETNRREVLASSKRIPATDSIT